MKLFLSLHRAVILALLTLLPFYSYAEKDLSSENVIVMTTAKKAGEQLDFYIESSAPVSFEGAEGEWENKKWITLTVRDQTIRIKGDIHTMNCRENMLQTLDISGCQTLKEISCSSNQLAEIDLTKNKALVSFNCSYNRISSLDLSQNRLLELLVCDTNNIQGEHMTSMIKSLPIRESRKGDCYVFNIHSDQEKNICLTSDVAIAQSRGWRTKAFNGIVVEDYPGSFPESLSLEPEGCPVISYDMVTDEIVISAAISGSIVRLFSFDGHMLSSTQIDARGCARLGVDVLNHICLLQVGEQVFKVSLP